MAPARQISDTGVGLVVTAIVEDDAVHLVGVREDGPGVELRLSVGYDGPEPTSIRLTLPGGLTASRLKRFPWDRYLTIADANRRSAAANQDVVKTKGVKGFSVVPPGGVVYVPTADNPLNPQRPWGAKRPNHFYKSVAERYTALRASGERNATDAIAKESGYNRNTVAGWVRKARKLGYLPPARRSRAG